MQGLAAGTRLARGEVGKTRRQHTTDDEEVGVNPSGVVKRKIQEATLYFFTEQYRGSRPPVSVTLPSWSCTTGIRIGRKAAMALGGPYACAGIK